MGNKDDGVAALSDTLHMFVQFFTALLGKRCRCLINNNDLWIKVGCLYDFYELTILEVVRVDHIGGLDSFKSILL